MTNLITDRKLRVGGDGKESFAEFLENTLSRKSAEVEGVEIIGRPFDRGVTEKEYYWQFTEHLYRDPVTKVLEIRPMSSVETKSPYVSYGNEPCLKYVYAQASMLIALDPAASREELEAGRGAGGV